LNLYNPILGNRYLLKTTTSRFSFSHVPELLKTFQELINLREPGEVIIPKSIYDQNDTDSMISIGKFSMNRKINFSYLQSNCLCSKLNFIPKL
jgi:rRNA pseudouridine-1189 N-methylase Emg1 (Nep1/Mra1 family)